MEYDCHNDLYQLLESFKVETHDATNRCNTSLQHITATGHLVFTVAMTSRCKDSCLVHPIDFGREEM